MEIEVRMCMKALAEDVGRCIRMDVRTINATFKGDDLWAWCIQYYDKYTVKE